MANTEEVFTARSYEFFRDLCQALKARNQHFAVNPTDEKKMDAIKGELVICGMNKDLRKVFKITNLDKLFKFADDEPGALELLGTTTAG